MASLVFIFTSLVLCPVSLFLPIDGKQPPLPSPCCEPAAYTVGYNALVSESFDDEALIYTWESDLAVNRGGNKEGTIVTISYDNGTIEKTRMISDFSTKSLWIINGLKCVKVKIDGEQSKGCIPDDAIYQGMDRAAFSDIPLEVGTWSWYEKKDTTNLLVGNASVTILLHDCRPVQEMFFGKSLYDGEYYPTVLSGTFRNFNYGILDPNKYFKVPQFCPQEFTLDTPVKINSR